MISLDNLTQASLLKITVCWMKEMKFIKNMKIYSMEEVKNQIILILICLLLLVKIMMYHPEIPLFHLYHRKIKLINLNLTIHLKVKIFKKYPIKIM